MKRDTHVAKVSDDLAQNLFQNYTYYHVSELNRQEIKRQDISPFIDQLKTSPGFHVAKIGESIEGREINLVKIGNGATKVMLWSQMHGDESTATRALFEIFRFFLSKDALDPFRRKILDEVTMLFIPMLNPDGAEVFKRRNALDIDLNRDALRLISPEAKLLKEIRNQYNPEFGFNLHDQSRYYNVGRSNKTASISFLAPAYNFEKDVNNTREKAMKLIVAMSDMLQQYIPGHVGRFNDDFEPRAFGDNIQKWDTSTVLLESGGHVNDPDKKFLVKMNFVALLFALDQIARKSYGTKITNKYFAIPENGKLYFDLLIRHVHIIKAGKAYLADIGVNREGNGETGGKIEDVGDLSTFFGYEELDAAGLEIRRGNIYPEIISDVSEITDDTAKRWLKGGFIAVRLENDASAKRKDVSICLLSQTEPELPTIAPDTPANFLLCKHENVLYAVVNGRLVRMDQ